MKVDGVSPYGAGFMQALSLGFAVLPVAQIFVAPTALADPDPDVDFIATLDSTGVPYASPAGVITVGHDICDQLHGGVDFTRVAQGAVSSGFTPAQAPNLISAAVGAYCPDEYPALHLWVAAGEPG